MTTVTGTTLLVSNTHPRHAAMEDILADYYAGGWTQHAFGGESGSQTIWHIGVGLACVCEANSSAARSALREAVMKFMAKVA